MQFYIHTYVFFAVNLGLQLFLGIVINNFNEHKPGHSFLLSVDQNRWVELMQRISLQRPYKLPQEPRKYASIHAVCKTMHPLIFYDFVCSHPFV